MSYTIVDILEKLILIEKKGLEAFSLLAKAEGLHHSIETIARVFAKEEERHIEIYQRLKEKTEKKADIDLDFYVYDKVAKLINEFYIPEMNIEELGRRDLLEFCLELEKKNLALVLSIRGILIKSAADVNSESYKVLSEIINEEEKHVSNIERFLN